MLATEEDDNMLIKYAIEGDVEKVESLLNMKYEFSVLLYVYKLTYPRGIKLKSNNTNIKPHSLLEQGQNALKCASLIHLQLEPYLNNNENKFKLAMVLCKTNFDIFNEYVENYKFNFNQTYKGKSLLHVACKCENIDIVKLLVNHNININQQNIWEDYYHQTALHIAVVNYNIDIIKILLQKKCNVNILDYYKKPPLYYVSPGENGHQGIFELLVKNGADINYKYHEQTLLYKAVDENCLMTVNYLLTLGASPFIPSLSENNYQTPLQLALNFEDTNIQIIVILKNENLKLHNQKISCYFLC